MSRSLVCGIDGSDQSIVAAAAAARLAEGLDLTLLLAEVAEHEQTLPNGGELEAERRRNRTEGFERRLADQLPEGLDRIAIEGRMLHGDPARALCELAEAEDAALVALGSRGRGPAKAALLGSVSWAVVRAAGRPVMVVPPGATVGHGGRPRTVVCGVDDSAEASCAARVASELAAALRLRLVLVHAYLPAAPSASIPAPGMAPPIDHERLQERQRTDARRLLEGLMRETGPGAPPAARMEAGDPVTALERAGDEESAELLVVGTQGKGALASVLAGSASARLAAFASRPVVLVPEGAALRAGSGAEPRDAARARGPNAA